MNCPTSTFGLDLIVSRDCDGNAVRTLHAVVECGGCDWRYELVSRDGRKAKFWQLVTYADGERRVLASCAQQVSRSARVAAETVYTFTATPRGIVACLAREWTMRGGRDLGL